MADNKWQPIESAPRDCDVLAFFPDLDPQIMIVHRFDDGSEEWYGQDADAQPEPIPSDPTHWMPLPDPPAAASVCENCGHYLDLKGRCEVCDPNWMFSQS